jgi:hypothetical protein
MRSFASWTSIVVGAVMVVAGVVTWIVVSTTLADQKITTSEDACLPNRDIKGPFTAYCEADVIDKHVREQTGGKTYAQLDRDDPLRETAMTGSFLQASLFTSVVAFGVAFMAVGVGLVFVVIGLGLRSPTAVASGGGRRAAPEPEAPAPA